MSNIENIMSRMVDAATNSSAADTAVEPSRIQALQPRCDKTWIQTFSGAKFWPLNARPEEIFIGDIAHALAHKCRFGGHVKTFYSVAQHSHIMSYYSEPEIAKWCLMHDAAEAYLPDVTKPIKHLIPGFIEAEDRLLEVIAERFNLTWPMPERVAHWDLRMLVTEARDLMPNNDNNLVRDSDVESLPFPLHTLDPVSAKHGWLERFYRLFGSSVKVPMNHAG